MHDISINIRATVTQMTGLCTDPHTHGRMTLCAPILIQALRSIGDCVFIFPKTSRCALLLETALIMETVLIMETALIMEIIRYPIICTVFSPCITCSLGRAIWS